MKHSDVKALVAFYNRYSTGSATCEQCHTRVPAEQITMMPVSIDPETGMPDEEQALCDECMEPARTQQEETDSGYEPKYEPEPDSPLFDFQPWSA